MKCLPAHILHESLNASFQVVNECEFVAAYDDWRREHSALTTAAGVLDLSTRGRLCLLGADRLPFLHGQVTHDVKSLPPGRGTYAFIVNARGRIEADVNIFRLEDELLLDVEPGVEESVARRLERYIIADDVQIVDASPHYGLLSVQGPLAAKAMERLALIDPLPHLALSFQKVTDGTLGELYVMNHARLGTAGFDLYVPAASLDAVLDRLIAAARAEGGGPCGWQAMETARIEAGIPRFGQDMDDSNLAPEAGVTDRAIHPGKGCYIGQEVIARIRTYGQVTRELRGLKLPETLKELPPKGTGLYHGAKEVGRITSAVHSPRLSANIALGYVRRECNQPGAILHLSAPDGPPVHVVQRPLVG